MIKFFFGKHLLWSEASIVTVLHRNLPLLCLFLLRVTAGPDCPHDPVEGVHGQVERPHRGEEVADHRHQRHVAVRGGEVGLEDDDGDARVLDGGLQGERDHLLPVEAEQQREEDADAVAGEAETRPRHQVVPGHAREKESAIISTVDTFLYIRIKKSSEIYDLLAYWCRCQVLEL